MGPRRGNCRQGFDRFAGKELAAAARSLVLPAVACGPMWGRRPRPATSGLLLSNPLVPVGGAAAQRGISRNALTTCKALRREEKEALKNARLPNATHEEPTPDWRDGEACPRRQGYFPNGRRRRSAAAKTAAPAMWAIAHPRATASAVTTVSQPPSMTTGRVRSGWAAGNATSPGPSRGESHPPRGLGSIQRPSHGENRSGPAINAQRGSGEKSVASRV